MSRVIEPRNLSFVGVDAVTGAEDHADVPRGRAQRSHRGPPDRVESLARAQGMSRNLGGLRPLL